MEEFVETNRLTLAPCPPARLAEKQGVETDEHLKNAYGQMLAGCLAHPFEWMWFTDWDILLRETGEVLGGAGFKGPPDEQGRVEVGYGIAEKHRRKGYMSEALEGLCRWAFAQERVRLILSEVESWNDNSVKTLLKNGFSEIAPRENRWFQKEKR